MIETTSLCKSYPSPDGELTVLSKVNLKVEKGTSVAILGPSGSGKSTLLNLIGLLDKPTRGRVMVNQKDLSALSEEETARYRNQTVGFVFQSHHLIPSCTVLENVMIPAFAGFGEWKGENLRKKATELLEEVGLMERANHFPSQISGGERQRVAVARSLINEPEVLLADEPTGALDRKNSDRLIALLGHFNESRNLTLMMVTHSADGADLMKQAYRFEEGSLQRER